MRPPDAPIMDPFQSTAMKASEVKSSADELEKSIVEITKSEEKKRNVLCSIENVTQRKRRSRRRKIRNRSSSLTSISDCSVDSDYVDTSNEWTSLKETKADSDDEFTDCKDWASTDDSVDCEYNFRPYKRKKKRRELSPKVNSICKYCKEEIKTVLSHSKPPLKAKTEHDILDQPELVSSVSSEGKAQLRLTGYCIYDEAGHLCFFDGDLIPNNVNLKFYGYVKNIDDDTNGISGGFPVVDAGPISQWWVAGLDVGEDAIIGISTDIADYYLIDPAVEYAPFVKTVTQKILVAKVVFEFLQSKEDNLNEMTYNNLLKELETRDLPEGLTSVSEGTLLKYAGFIYGQIKGYGCEDGENQILVESGCMKELSKFSQNTPLTFASGSVKRKKGITAYKRQDPSYTKATATFLVANSFSSLFCEQINRSSSNPFNQRLSLRLTRLEDREDIPEDYRTIIKDWKKRGTIKNLGPCRISNGYESAALLEHKYIALNIIKPCSVRLSRLNNDIVSRYWKNGMSKKICFNKNQKKEGLSTKSGKEKNKRPRYSDDSDFSGDEFIPKKQRKFSPKKCYWIGEPDEVSDNICYFQAAMIGEDRIATGSFVTKYDTTDFGQVKYLFEDDAGRMKAHLQWFLSSYDTVLGDCGNSREIFLIESCENIELKTIDSVKDVRKVSLKTNWAEFREASSNEWLSFLSPDENKVYFYKQRYNRKHGVFEDLEFDDNKKQYHCSNCDKQERIRNREIPKCVGEVEFDKETKTYIISCVEWRDETFKLGSSVFLLPGTVRQVKPQTKVIKHEKEVYDEERYPEKYRKNFTNDTEENETIEPFEIAYICGIHSKKKDICSARDINLTVNTFYRPDNIGFGKREASRLDLNLLYWSDEQTVHKLDKVMGKCYVVYEDNIAMSVHEWTENGPNRFYFKEAYDKKTKKIVEPSLSVKKIGQFHKKKNGKKTVLGDLPVDWAPIQRPLRSLDVFAGCGGLSEGLHQSGIAETLWAIEKLKPPAEAFSRNFPDCSVFIDDCNNILDTIIDGKTMKKGKKLPMKGEVELLCGGPPCQGFSRMNRFSHGEYSKYKNSLVVSFVSYCDYFRPRFFVLENVRGFVQSNSNKTMKMTLSALVSMGYQVAFSVLQCGAYGIPQNRRRVIIIAAAPGEVLPKFPEPTHSFYQLVLDVNIDGEKYEPDLKWSTAAPYRHITVYDAISDLPEITNNGGLNSQEYGREPFTYFQKQMRKNKNSGVDLVRDHDCKKMAPLIRERIKYIPTTPGNDWRDLPNIVVKLSDGTYTKKLMYTHNDYKYGKAKNGSLRGVCICATHSKVKCNQTTFKQYRQLNTIIPWCLPHTSARHNQWSGLYGRIPWDGHFRTVVTNPEPMGKQGRVLHPDQDRVVSVRETARSQGFPDYFQFSGGVCDRYSQVGNAVAPPLARCIGNEIRKSVAIVERRRTGSKSEKL